MMTKCNMKNLSVINSDISWWFLMNTECVIFPYKLIWFLESRTQSSIICVSLPFHFLGHGPTWLSSTEPHWWNVLMRPQAIEVKGEINGVPTCLQSTIKTGKDPFPDLGIKKKHTITHNTNFMALWLEFIVEADVLWLNT